MRSEHYKILIAAHEQIRALDLPGVAGDQVHLRWVVADRDVELPSVVVTPEGQEVSPPGTFEDDDYDYPVTVFFLAASNQNMPVEEEPLLWRQTVVQHFTDTPLRGHGQSWDVQIEFGPVIDPQLWLERNLIGGWILLLARTRQERPRKA